MSEESVRHAAILAKSGHVDRIILSTAYERMWAYEADLKKKMLSDLGIDLELVSVIPAVTNSYNEAEAVRQFVQTLGIDTLIVVADKWHEPRATETFRWLFPDLKIFGYSFTTSTYEFSEEPSMIKSLRAGIVPLWVGWNLLFWFLTPLIAKRLSRSD